MTKTHDMIGKTFGRLTVLERDRTVPAGKTKYRCRCQCGTAKTVTGSHLREGTTVSCGCHRKEKAYRHGRTCTAEHTAWKGIRRRCNNPNCPSYKWYGAKGVSVCERWDDFSAFLNDVGPRPSPDHSIDRIDPFGNYEPGNCRWATAEEQALNRRASHIRRFCNA